MKGPPKVTHRLRTEPPASFVSASGCEGKGGCWQPWAEVLREQGLQETGPFLTSGLESLLQSCSLCQAQRRWGARGSCGFPSPPIAPSQSPAWGQAPEWGDTDWHQAWGSLREQVPAPSFCRQGHRGPERMRYPFKVTQTQTRVLWSLTTALSTGHQFPWNSNSSLGSQSSG